MSLEQAITERVGQVRTDSFDMSFGEIASLHDAKELIIQPEYQRLFRWSMVQRSQLVESILLELPIPQIFVIENIDGVLELIDGLQRVSTVLHFMNSALIGLEPLRLEGCSLISALNGYTFAELPLSLRLGLKRTPIRTVVIKKQSQAFLRYEMFRRLNTGGSNLAPQEIRNCSARMLGDKGVEFYAFLVKLSQLQVFCEFAEYIAEAERDKKAAEELVLRFFATKNSPDTFKGSVREWLDEYMENVVLGSVPFDYSVEAQEFESVMRLILEKLGATAFLRYRGDAPVGSLPPAYFEAITMGAFKAKESLRRKDAGRLRSSLTGLIQSDAFREVTGPGANSREKLGRRIALVTEVFENA